MFNRPRGANAYSQVSLETAVQSADPHQLILMLYDGALMALAQAVVAMEQTKRSCQAAADTTGQVTGGLDSMADSVVQIHDLSSQIATAAEEQSEILAAQVEERSMALPAVEDTLPVTCLPYDDRVEMPEGTVAQVVAADHPVMAGLTGRAWPPLLGVAGSRGAGRTRRTAVSRGRR